ncbi:UNVERIFIED_CONTAM: hypothetical protein FKN15_009464 [Acipenser sinensis]
MAALAAARRQLWIAQARLPYKDKALLLDAPVTPGTPKSRFRLLQPLLELMHRTVFTVRNTEAAHKQQPQLNELSLVNNHLLQLSKYNGQVLGRSMAALAAARRQLWIAQARLPYKDKALLLDAPVTPGTPKSRFRLLQPLLELMHRTVFTVRNTEAAHKQQPQW